MAPGNLPELLFFPAGEDEATRRHPLFLETYFLLEEEVFCRLPPYPEVSPAWRVDGQSRERQSKPPQREARSLKVRLFTENCLSMSVFS